MEKRRVLVIVCVVLVSMVLGLVSVSAPKQVRADEIPPISLGPNGEIPVGYGPLFEEQFSDDEKDAGMQEYLTAKPEPENQTMAAGQVASYGALGFSYFSDKFFYTYPGCVASSNSTYVGAGYQTVNLPHGSRITYIDFSGSDDSSTDEMFLSFTRNSYDNQSGIELARLYSGSSFSGGRFVVGKSLDHQVINTTYSYLLTISFPKFVSGKNLCANQVTIWYTPPSVFALALPLIER